MKASRGVYAQGRRKVKARGYLRVGQLDGNEAGEPWLLHGDAVENVGGLHGLAVVSDDDELGLRAELAQHADEAVDVRVVERSIHLVEDAEGTGAIVEDREEQGQPGESTLPARHERDGLKPLAPRLSHELDPQLERIVLPFLRRHHAELRPAAFEEPLENSREVAVDLLERLLEALLGGACHATKRAVEVLHRLDEIVVLAAEKFEPLLELAVLVVCHEVDRAHPLELGPQFLVPRLDTLEISRRIVGGEQHLRALHRVTAAGLLEELFAPDPTFCLFEIQLVDARDQAVEITVGLPHSALDRLPLVETPRVFLGEHRHIPLFAIALGSDFTRALVSASLLATQLLATLEKLRPSVRRFLEASAAFHAYLAQAVDFASQRFHAFQHRGEIDTACCGVGDDGRLLHLIGLEPGPKRRHLPLDVAFARGDEGHAVFESLELPSGRARLTLQLATFRLEGFQMPPHSFRLTVSRLDVLLAGEAGCFLSMNRDLQNFLAAAERFDLPVESLESSLLLFRLQREVAQLFRQLPQRSLPAEQRMVIGLPLALPPPARQRPRRRQHLPRPRDVGRHDVRSSPEPLRHIEMGDHPHPPEQMPHQLRTRAPHEAIRPGDFALVTRRLGVAVGRQCFERYEGGGSRALPLEIREGSSSMLESLDDDPLEAVAEHRLHRRFETWGNFEEIGNRADHARHRRARLRREERSHACTVAFALALESPESLPGRLLRGHGHPQGRQRFLSLTSEGFLPAEL